MKEKPQEKSQSDAITIVFVVVMSILAILVTLSTQGCALHAHNESELESVNKKLLSLEAEIDAGAIDQREQIQGIAVQLQAIQDKIERDKSNDGEGLLEGDIASISEQLSLWRIEVEAIKQQYAERNNKASDLNSEIAKLHAGIEALVDELNSAENEVIEIIITPE